MARKPHVVPTYENRSNLEKVRINAAIGDGLENDPKFAKKFMDAVKTQIEITPSMFTQDITLRRNAFQSVLNATRDELAKNMQTIPHVSENGVDLHSTNLERQTARFRAVWDKETAQEVVKTLSLQENKEFKYGRETVKQVMPKFSDEIHRKAVFATLTDTLSTVVSKILAKQLNVSGITLDEGLAVAAAPLPTKERVLG